MGTFFLVMQLLGGLMPIIQQGILAVEQPGVPGTQKAATVTDLALGTLNAVDPGLLAKAGHNKVFAGIQSIITHLVSGFNKSGVLPKPAPGPTENATAQGGPAPKPTIAGSANLADRTGA